MRIAFCGLALTMLAQPTVDLDNCAFACAAPELRTAAPLLGIPIERHVVQPAVAMLPIRQSALRSSVRRPGAIKAVTPKIEILRYEHPAIYNEDVIGGDRIDRLSALAAPTLTDGLNAEATRVKASVAYDTYSAGRGKWPMQQAQDAWDARRNLAYVAPIIPQEFDYIQIQEAASGALQMIPSSVGSNALKLGDEKQPSAENITENHNNKSQAPSVPAVGKQLELLTK